MRSFYSVFPIQGAVRPESGWTHYRNLIRIDKPEARQWYQQESKTRQGARSDAGLTEGNDHDKTH
jgi:hypothetical protein